MFIKPPLKYIPYDGSPTTVAMVVVVAAASVGRLPSPDNFLGLHVNKTRAIKQVSYLSLKFETSSIKHRLKRYLFWSFLESNK
jgi:hypothetical protein